MPSKATNSEPITAASPQRNVIGPSWPPAPQDLALRDGEIHVWCAAPAAFFPELDRFRSLISQPELARAARFHFPVHRDHYIIRHGILRLILGRYLRQEPSRIEFGQGKFGKPTVKTDSSLHFNDSHSGDLALFAFTKLGPIGVDIECVRPIPDFENIAARYFCAREIALMRELSPDDKMTAFFSCWTGKEAYLKATGEGIGQGLDKVEIKLDENLRATALHIPGDVHTHWTIGAFTPAPRYLGAVALVGEIPAVSQWQFCASSL